MFIKCLELKENIGVIFSVDGESSDILYLSIEDAKVLRDLSELAVDKKNTESSIFTGNDKFTYIKQDNASYLLSIKVNSFFAKGYVLDYRLLRSLIFSLNKTIGIK